MLSITSLRHRVRVTVHGLLFVGALAIFMSASALAASSVTLAWDSTTNNIAGYKIYYGVASHTYTHTNTLADSKATSLTISNLIVGTTYYFAATAYDSANLESDFSNEAIYTNIALAPPVITLSSPANNAGFTAPATINLGASVTANGHSITSVQFYNGTTLLGGDTTAPYTFNWSSVGAGSYGLTAQVVYDSGSTLASTAANVTVTNQLPPAIALTSPANNAAFTAPANINLAASVTANGHSITSVQFYNGTTLLGGDTTAPYTFNWSSVGAGSYSLTAQVVYDSGSTLASTAASVTVTNQLPPAIALNSPANNAAFTAPANINLAASVTANGHSITSVQFYNGTTLLGGDTTAPYTFNWSSVGAGSYSLTAQVVYDSGSTLASTAASVTVTNQLPPAIALNSPANNAAFTAPANINLGASVTANGHSITSVQFYNGTTLLGGDTTAPYTFNWSSVGAGSYSLTAQVVYDSGSTLASSAANVTVTNLPPPVIVLASPVNGAIFTAPATINLAASVTTNGHSITQVQYYNGTNLLGQGINARYTFSWSDVPNGSYSLTARLVYDAGTTLDSTPAVNVLVAAPRPANTLPTITTIADQTTSQDTATPPISFTVGDTETAASNLTVYATSADPALVPTNNISFGGGDSDRTVTLTPVSGATGTVAITVFVSDGIALTNTTFQLTVQAAPAAEPTLATDGSGTISSGLDTQTMTPGQIYTVTAVPAEGQEFAGWSGSINCSDPRLTFVMSSNLALTAKFTPRKPASGGGKASSIYSGLFFQEDAINLASAGSFTVSVTTRGRYSGRILLGTKRYTISGLLNTTNNSGTNVIKRVGGPALNLDFQIGGDQADQISGHLSDSTWTALLSGDLAVFGRTNRAPFAGDYTLVVPGYDGISSLPAGDSYGTLKVNSAGQVKFVGTLADGTKVSQSATLSRAGYWPLHIPLYSGNGVMMSWLTFVSPTYDLSGNLTWIKQAGSKSKYYLAGFTCQSDVFGSKYLRTNPILNLPTACLTFSGGSLATSITSTISIGAGSKVVTPGNQLRLSFSTSTGTFKGTFLDPVTARPLTFSGVVFQNLNAAYGVLFGTGDQTSEVTLTP